MDETLKKELVTMLDDFKKGLPTSMTAEEVSKAVDVKMKEFETNFAEKGVSKEDFQKLEKAMKEQGEFLVTLQNKTGKEETLSISDSIVKMFAEKDIKNLSDARKNANVEIELKSLHPYAPVEKDENPVSNTSYTGDYSRTQSVGDVKFPKDRPLAFLDKVMRGIVTTGKNIILWTVGTFTEVVGYAGELDDITTGTTEISGSSATATDKTRRLAKIAARMVLSEEVFEDLPQFAQRLQQKLIDKVNLWLDQKIWDGDGNDSTATQHVYGVINSCTAFDSTNAVKVEKANVADLADACSLQAEDSEYMANKVWMSPQLVYKLQHTKNSNGDYIIIRLADGTLAMNGLTVVKTKLMRKSSTGIESMLVGDANLIQLWVKRNLTAEIVRNAKRDSYDLYLYARNQVLVENEDIKGLIYVADVATALTNITAS